MVDYGDDKFKLGSNLQQDDQEHGDDAAYNGETGN